MWIHDFASIICWVHCLFPNVYFCICVKENSSGYICLCLHLSVPLINMCVSVPILCYFCYHGSVFLKPNVIMMPPAPFFWLRIVLAILSACAFVCILELFQPSTKETHWKFYRKWTESIGNFVCLLIFFHVQLIIWHYIVNLYDFVYFL